MDERWKAIKDYEGLYEVSNKGNIRRICKKYSEGRPVKLQTDKDGYKRVCLCKDNKRKTWIVHRLVADAFIPNPNCFPAVNHKDENKENNNINNLEWCTVRYNNSYHDGAIKRAAKRCKPIKAIKSGIELKFNSIKDASASLNISHGDISGCLHGAYGRKTCKGYSFEFIEN